jgi:hypothetical protein
MQVRSIFQMSNPHSQLIINDMNSSEITIRPAYADDQVGLQRLASLDSVASVPPHPLLVAEVDGELRAALSVDDGRAISDPFFPTASILDLLRTHARRGPRRPRLRRTLGTGRLARRAPAWSR